MKQLAHRAVAVAVVTLLSGTATAATLTDGIEPRTVWHYLGDDARQAHDDPTAPGNAWGEGLQALLDQATPAVDRIDEALPIWLELADAGDIPSAQAACLWGEVFRIGFRAVAGKRGDRTLRPNIRARYCELAPGPWAAKHRAYAVWLDCIEGARVTAAKHRVKAATRQCTLDHIDTLVPIASEWPSAYANIGLFWWDVPRIKKAQRAWQAGTDEGSVLPMIALAFGDTYRQRHDRGNHPLPPVIRVIIEVKCAHTRKCAKRWKRRLPLLLEAAMSGDEEAMYRYAEAQVALLSAEQGKIEWTHTKAPINEKYPLTPAEMQVGASLLRGHPDLADPDTRKYLAAGRDRRIEAMAWLAIVVGWTEPGEQIAGAGIYRPSFAHQNAEILLEVLEEVSTKDDLQAAAARRDELLPTLGPGLTVWDYGPLPRPPRPGRRSVTWDLWDLHTGLHLSWWPGLESVGHALFRPGGLLRLSVRGVPRHRHRPLRTEPLAYARGGPGRRSPPPRWYLASCLLAPEPGACPLLPGSMSRGSSKRVPS